ncbi:hypothetical protein BH09ACT8_BH09ACT8_02710 [soil metagenome]
MSRKLRLIAPLFAAGAAAAIMLAPAASAETHLQCTNPSGNSTVCETPGNVQLNATTDGGTAYPQYGYPFLYGPAIDLGGLLNGGHHDGGGGGGHGGGGGGHGSGR